MKNHAPNHPNFFKAFLVTILLFSSLGTGLIAQTSAQTLPPPTIYLPLVASTNKGASGSPWPMAAANPQRTSWTPEEIKGNLSPIWYKPFEPYIQPKVQIITANGMLYISTSKGLYALDAKTGAEKWVFPTEMPLGNSPTIDNNIAYVGGLDHKLYAIDALTGKEIWNFEASAGFETNPLVVGDKVFLGNRDGYFYAIYIQGAKTSQLAWRYQTQGPILFSAAYKEGVVFFASDDSHAYAINADSGTLVWKSAKLSGAGFHSWWPVVYRDRVIFAGSSNYRTVKPGSPSLIQLQKEDVFPNYATDPRGTLVGPLGHAPGDWVQNTLTLDASRIMNYFNSKPWRKTYFVLDRFTGKEREVAPVLWINPQDGNQYPPVVGGDGVLYQDNVYMSDPYIPGGQITGWKIGTPYISIISSDWNADDEPEAASAGGNLIYWNLCCSRQAGSIDISKPFTTFTPPPGKRDKTRESFYFNYNLRDLAPGFDVSVYNQRDNNGDYAATAVYDSPYGVYGFHGDQNPPIPYDGKVYIHLGNAVFAFGDASTQPVKLPIAKIVAAPSTNLNTPSLNELKSELAVQVQKIVNAGHLLPGYSSTALFGTKGKTCGDDLTDYWHNPGDTLYTLIISLPYLPAGLQQQTRAYLQSEFSAYPPYKFNHIGWQTGTPRQIFDFPPEVNADLKNYPPEQANYDFAGWRFAPQSFYALWKYAATFGNAKDIYNQSKGKLPTPPSDDILLKMPHVQNAYIAGYIGYLQLEQLAGEPESTSVRNTLNQLLTYRVSNFSAGTAYVNTKDYCRALTVAQNFMYLVPELADYLRSNALSKVQTALNEYYLISPYWFVASTSNAFGEDRTDHLYDREAIFQAKALILKDSRGELAKYLDVPSFAIGDLFYIQNLVYTIEANN